jgi:hypothetical protein
MKLTATVTPVESDDAVQTLIESNVSRSQVVVYNGADKTLYVKLGSDASSSDFTYALETGDTLIESEYLGIITGTWGSSPTGSAFVTEL